MVGGGGGGVDEHVGEIAEAQSRANEELGRLAALFFDLFDGVEGAESVMAMAPEAF